MQLRRFARIKLVPLPWKCGGGFAAAAWDRGAGPSGGIKCGDNPPTWISECFMSVYVDGARYYSPEMNEVPPDLDRLNVLTLEAVEIYRSPAEVPVEYNATGSACGLILLWTRAP